MCRSGGENTTLRTSWGKVCTSWFKRITPISSATNAACSSNNSKVTTAYLASCWPPWMVEEGDIWHSQLVYEDPGLAPAPKINVSRPITGLQEVHNSQAFTVGRKKNSFFSNFFSGRPASRCAPKHVCAKVHANIRRIDCVGPTLSQI